MGFGCLLGCLLNNKHSLIHINSFLNNELKTFINAEEASKLSLNGALELFLELKDFLAGTKMENCSESLEFGCKGVCRTRLFESMEVATYLFKVQRIFVKVVQLGPKNASEKEHEVFRVTTEDDVCSCDRAITQAGDDEIDFVAVIKIGRAHV